MPPAPEELTARLADVDCKLVDFGNACWTHKQFTQDIQTRQYRCPEAGPCPPPPPPRWSHCSRALPDVDQVSCTAGLLAVEQGCRQQLCCSGGARQLHLRRFTLAARYLAHSSCGCEHGLRLHQPTPPGALRRALGRACPAALLFDADTLPCALTQLMLH